MFPEPDDDVEAIVYTAALIVTAVYGLVKAFFFNG